MTTWRLMPISKISQLAGRENLIITCDLQLLILWKISISYIYVSIQNFSLIDFEPKIMQMMHFCHESSSRCPQFCFCSINSLMHLCWTLKQDYWYKDGAGLWLAIVIMTSSHTKLPISLFWTQNDTYLNSNILVHYNRLLCIMWK
jgi:hypothetical protein